MNTSQILHVARTILQEIETNHPELKDRTQKIHFRVSNKMVRAAGKANIGTHEITLSMPFFADDSNCGKELRDTIIHEICHILVPPQAGFGRSNRDVHGPRFRAMNRALGGSGDRCHSLELSKGYKKYKRHDRVEAPCFRCGKPLQLTKRRAAPYLDGIRRGSMGPGTNYGYAHHTCPE